MESNGNEKIKDLLEELIKLLNENQQARWGECLNGLLDNYTSATIKAETVIAIMKVMLGGAGSLSDLVLHKDGRPLIDENNKMYNLLNELYEACKEKIACQEP